MADAPYSAHEILVAPARRYPQLWRLVVGLFLAAVIAIILSRTVQTILVSVFPGLARQPEAFVTGNAPAALLILLSSFGFVSVGVLVAAKVMQHRSPLGVIGPIPLAIRQFWQVSRWLLGLGLVLFALPPYDMGVPLVTNLEPMLWLSLLPFSLLAVLLQTSAEEILFRGYVQQALAARFRSKLVWMGVPALLFALGHYLPGEAGDNAVLIAIWSGVFGLVTADLTARAGTLGPAIAVHLFNNITALLIVSLPDNLSGLSLYTTPFSMADTGTLRAWLVVDFAVMATSWLAARVAIGR